MIKIFNIRIMTKRGLKEFVEDVALKGLVESKIAQEKLLDKIDHYNKLLEQKQKGENTVKEAKLKATVVSVSRAKIVLEFGRVQCDMSFSGTGNMARKLRLQKGDKVSVNLKTLGK